MEFGGSCKNSYSGTALQGLFGFIGSKEAKVELELIPDPLEETIAFLQDMFEAMNLKSP